MTKREAILERIHRGQVALEKAHEYLATGAESQWHGFQPFFEHSDRAPHRDWVEHVFVRSCRHALDKSEIALDTLTRKTKERRLSERRKASE